MTAEYKVLGDVAVITMTNPPVNGLGFSTRIGITDGLSKANADDRSEEHTSELQSL